MKKNEASSFSKLVIAVFIMAACGTVISCDDNNDNNPPPAETAKVKLGTSTTLGAYLTDADGNALYFFSNDVAGQNTCTGNCATNWPIYDAGTLTADMVGTGLSLDDFGTVTAAAGAQTTYKGWPLYYYAPSGAREPSGVTTGEAVGDVWFVAKTDYTFMIANSQLIGMDGKHYKGDYTEGDAKVKYFTDAKGRTVYGFTNDKKNDNNFTTGDATHDANWPIYTATMGSIPSTLDKSLFGTITVMGNTQLTYKGWPLYYFGNDATRGDNKGVSVPTPGKWPVVVSDIVAAPEATPPVLKLTTSTTLGEYLTDADGNTLYFFSNDVAGQNTCTGGCATNWPIYNAGSLTADMLGTGLSLADFGTVSGGTQTTYKGWPLYYYAPGGTREASGATTGEAVGGIWFVAKTDYTFMIANTQLVGLDGKHYKGDYTEGDAKVKYFTDSKGRSIYVFTNDKKDDNNFTTGDAAHDANWPIYTATMGSIPSTLDKSLFGTITVMGNTQLTYKGWPLYYFGNDAVRGDNKGVSVPTPGKWPVVVSDIVEAPL